MDLTLDVNVDIYPLQVRLFAASEECQFCTHHKLNRLVLYFALKEGQN